MGDVFAWVLIFELTEEVNWRTCVTLSYLVVQSLAIFLLLRGSHENMSHSFRYHLCVAFGCCASSTNGQKRSGLCSVANKRTGPVCKRQRGVSGREREGRTLDYRMRPIKAPFHFFAAFVCEALWEGAESGSRLFLPHTIGGSSLWPFRATPKGAFLKEERKGGKKEKSVTSKRERERGSLRTRAV